MGAHHLAAVALIGLGVEFPVVAQPEILHGILVLFLHQQVFPDAHIGGFHVGAQPQHFFKVFRGLVPPAVVIGFVGVQQRLAEL